MTVKIGCERCDASLNRSDNYCFKCGFAMIGERNSEEMVEKLADLIHYQWSHWMKYLKSKMAFSQKPLLQLYDKDGNPSDKAYEVAIVKKDWDRWERQMNTPYDKLSEEEKESDREWARKMLNTVRTGKIHYTKVAADAPRPTFEGVKHGDKVKWKGREVYIDMSGFPYEASLVDRIPKPMIKPDDKEEDDLLESMKRELESRRDIVIEDDFTPRGDLEELLGVNVDRYTCPQCGGGLEVTTAGRWCFNDGCLWEDDS